MSEYFYCLVFSAISVTVSYYLAISVTVRYHSGVFILLLSITVRCYLVITLSGGLSDVCVMFMSYSMCQHHNCHEYRCKVLSDIIWMSGSLSGVMSTVSVCATVRYCMVNVFALPDAVLLAMPDILFF